MVRGRSGVWSSSGIGATFAASTVGVDDELAIVGVWLMVCIFAGSESSWILCCYK